ncbi:MAG: glycosyltransferase family 2 protein [Chloroflexi bacterium]|nr:glycosyltransferase family 2 protein [Chloroflexota bacterium]
MPARPTLSVCMIVKNERENLPRCLGSVRRAADDLVVVDTGSSDDSAAVAAGLGARVLSFPWRDDFAAARNFALDNARGDWLLVMDADEELAPRSLSILKTCLRSTKADALSLRVRNFHPPGSLREYTDVAQIRLFRNLPGFRYQGSVHEHIRASIQNAGGRIAPCEVILWHHGYAQVIVQGGESRQARNLRLLEAAAAREVNNAYLQAKLGLTCYAAGQFGLAQERLERSLALAGEQPGRPFDEIAHAALAALCQLALAQGDGARAAHYAAQSAAAAQNETQRRASADLTQQAAALLSPDSAPRPSAAETLERLLDSPDLLAELDACRPWLDADLLTLVRANVQAAQVAGETDLAEGLRCLAAYIEGMSSL